MVMWNGQVIGQRPGVRPGSLPPSGFPRSQRDCKKDGIIITYNLSGLKRMETYRFV